MFEIAEDVFLLEGRPRFAYNVYLLGDILVDAGSRHAERRILRQLAGREVRAHAVTHAHPDHQGSSHAVCERLRLPLWCGAADADALESGDLTPVTPDVAIARWQLAHWAGPAHPVARRLREGDVVGGFTVLETPGHTPGSVSFWREADRVLIAGDVVNRRPLVMGGALAEAPVAFCVDPARNRESIRRLAGLDPRIVCVGHGHPLRDTGQLADLAARLPA
ncbi:MBL fold metallo-hydrolase [Amycolatopsis sp. NPDC059021]|uniref:MBL fold metallo-hydrolase n=1 Tax=Amycolatopsis sp. NPDC059021 TaxID=3346704 RepID=UPI00366BF0F5